MSNHGQWVGSSLVAMGKKTYTLRKKIEAVKYYKKGHSTVETALEFVVSPSTVKTWSEDDIILSKIKEEEAEIRKRKKNKSPDIDQDTIKQYLTDAIESVKFELNFMNVKDKMSYVKLLTDVHKSGIYSAENGKDKGKSSPIQEVLKKYSHLMPKQNKGGDACA